MQNAYGVKLAELVKTFGKIEGDYEETLISGVAHYLADSGIWTDSLSKADAEKVLAATAGIERGTSEWDGVAMATKGLECTTLMKALEDVAAEYDVDIEELALELAEME